MWGHLGLPWSPSSAGQAARWACLGGASVLLVAPCPLGRDRWGVGAGRTVCQKRLVQGAAAPLRARLQPLALLCSGLSHR